MSEVEDQIERERYLARYRGGKSLGRGGQGHVFEYFYAPTNKTYAVKVIEYDSDVVEDRATSNPSYVIREQVTVKNFDHVWTQLPFVYRS